MQRVRVATGGRLCNFQNLNIILRNLSEIMDPIFGPFDNMTCDTADPYSSCDIFGMFP